MVKRILFTTVVFFSSLAFAQDKKEVTLKNLNFDKEKGMVSYELTRRAWVRIRCGIEDGPMYKTLLNWQERQPGKHQEKWDGFDASGNFNLLKYNKEKTVFTFNYVTEGQDYYDLTEGQFMPLAEQVRIGKVLPTFRINELHKLHKRENCHEPKVTIVFAEDLAGNKEGTAIIRKPTAIRFELAKPDKLWFNQEGYSVHIFVDDVFVCGEWQGYSPYNWVIDPKKMNPGRHIIAVNFSGYNDHMGCASLPIYVEK